MASKMILSVLILFLSTRLAESMDQGESCTFTDGNPGVCTLLKNCQSARQQLIEGNEPDKICGYSGFEPIVCCPPSSSPVNSKSDGRGAISKEKCSEYARSVYVLKESPVLLDGPPKLVNVSECALTNHLSIVGGPYVQIREFPHMAIIGFDSEDDTIVWLCSGTLISERFVLTAAHCTQTEELGNATWVRIGVANSLQTHDGAPPENRRIIERIIHPDYKPPAQYHNIALLRLETRVHFNRWIRPACLYTEPSTKHSKAILTDGAPRDMYDSASRVLKFLLSIVDSETCNTSWAFGRVDRRFPNGVVSDLLICADSNLRDACQSDSGGPLTVYSKNFCMYDVVGITNVGKFCGSQRPGLYTRVYHYVPWIESIVWGKDTVY